MCDQLRAAPGNGAISGRIGSSFRLITNVGGCRLAGLCDTPRLNLVLISGDGMTDQENDIPQMDYDEHNSTFASFVFATKYSVIGLAILLILMALFL